MQSVFLALSTKVYKIEYNNLTFFISFYWHFLAFLAFLTLALSTKVDRLMTKITRAIINSL